MQPARRLGSWPSGKPAASGRRPAARVTVLPAPPVLSAVEQVRRADASDPRPLCRDAWCWTRVERPGCLCAHHAEVHAPRGCAR